jgi:hypothetical protein
MTKAEMALSGIVVYLLWRKSRRAAFVEPEVSRPSSLSRLKARGETSGVTANAGGPDLNNAVIDVAPIRDGFPDTAIRRESESITADVPPENQSYADAVNAADPNPSVDWSFATPEQAAEANRQADTADAIDKQVAMLRSLGLIGGGAGPEAGTPVFQSSAGFNFSLGR